MQKNQTMKKLTFILALLSVILLTSFENINAQNHQNKTDKSGRRQGKWIVYHENGNVKYTGEFKNNEPVGEFLYYSENGELVAKNTHIKNTQISESEMYLNGKLIAKGKYMNQKKHEQWEYFSEDNGAVILVENYDKGLLTGKSIVYSPENHNIVEETEYKNGVKNGVYNSYYDNGKPLVKAFYTNDKLNGNYVSYYNNGVPKEEGVYKDGFKVGEWKTYDLEGNEISVDIHMQSDKE